MSPTPTHRDRVLGCLLGGALGDAWGGPYENAHPPIDFQIPKRPTLSDDTQLTLATCESLIERRKVDPESLAANFLSWFQQGRITGIGGATLKAMQGLAAGTHWALVGRRGEYAAGNGAAMRIAPLAFLLDTDDPTQRTVLRDVCRITHQNDEAYAGALAVVLAIRSVLSGGWSAQRNFLAVASEGLPDSAVRERIRDLLPLTVPPAEVASRFGSSGYVVDTVPLALYCAQGIAMGDLPTLLAQTILLGGDTDTIASITGQIAGCVAGHDSSLLGLVASIEDADHLLDVFRRFAAFAAQQAQESSSTRPAQGPHV